MLLSNNESEILKALELIRKVVFKLKVIELPYLYKFSENKFLTFEIKEGVEIKSQIEIDNTKKALIKKVNEQIKSLDFDNLSLEKLDNIINSACEAAKSPMARQ